MAVVTGGGGSETLVCEPKHKYIIRRLTPLECCRLQGFPDWWCSDIPHSDSAEYKMWGNGVALPCVLYVLEGIAKELKGQKIMTTDEAIKILNPDTNLNTLSFKDEQTAIEAVKTACFLACEKLSEIKETELRVLDNFINSMPKGYRTRTLNWLVVKDILMRGTATAGMTNCMEKCRELGIDPDGYRLEKDDD